MICRGLVIVVDGFWDALSFVTTPLAHRKGPSLLREGLFDAISWLCFRKRETLGCRGWCFLLRMHTCF